MNLLMILANAAEYLTIYVEVYMFYQVFVQPSDVEFLRVNGQVINCAKHIS